MVLKVTDFNHGFYCQTGVVVLKELIFDHFLLLAGVVVYERNHS